MPEPHQDMVPNQISLREWLALKVQAFKDQVGIVVITEVDHDDPQCALDSRQNLGTIDGIAVRVHASEQLVLK